MINIVITYLRNLCSWFLKLKYINFIYKKVSSLWDWLKGLKFFYYIIGFVFCDIFYPQYSNILAKIILVGIAILMLKDIDKNDFTELDFIEKLDDPLIGRNYALVITGIICGICYIIGN